MKKLLLVVFVALLVWAIGPELLPLRRDFGLYTWSPLSLLFALAGGLIMWGILSFLARSPERGTHPLALVAGGAVGALAFVYLSTMVAPRERGMAVPPVKVTCNPVAVDKPEVNVLVGQEMVWNLPDMGKTPVKIHAFKRKFVLWWLGTEVLGKEYNSTNGQSDIRLTIPEAANGRYFKYSITCGQGPGAATLDPMIDVPPH